MHLCVCVTFLKKKLHKSRGGGGVMHILNILQRSPEVCVFLPPKRQPISVVVAVLFTLPPGLQFGDEWCFFSVYLSPVVTFPNSGSVSWAPPKSLYDHTLSKPHLPSRQALSGVFWMLPERSHEQHLQKGK